MKKVFFSTMAVLSALFCVSVSSCDEAEDPVLVNEISFSSESLTILVGETAVLKVVYTPDNAENKSVVWTSNNESIVTVSSDGTITAVAEGTATITATTDNGVKRTCKVTVNNLATSSLNILVGLKKTIVLSGSDIEWTSDNKSVASVDDKGVVTAIADGSAEITARRGETKLVCTVKVSSLKDTTVYTNTTFKLSDFVDADFVNDNNITWSVNEEKALTFKDGLFETFRMGEVILTAKDGDDESKSKIIVTLDPTTYVDLGLPSGTLWGAYNIGAKVPELAGSYFAWGEIEPKTYDKFTEENYKYNSSNPKYDSNKDGVYLKIEDDAAHAILGEDWQIPTQSDVKEINENCKFIKMDGYWEVISKNNGNKMIIPVTYIDGYPDQEHPYYGFWIGELWSKDMSEARYADMHPWDTSTSFLDAENVTRKRYYGLNVRGIVKK